MALAQSSFSFAVGSKGTVSAAVYRAAEPLEATLVLAHGAGAPRTHPFMTSIALRIARRGVDVVTFNFLYSEAGRRMPDRAELLEACWHAAIATVRARGGLPTERLFIGGKSMGGRIATHIAALGEGPPISGLVLLGYPLHPIGKPTVVRREILEVSLPMLVVQGSEDKLGTAGEMVRLLKGKGHARVVPVEGGDHSFHLRNLPGGRSGADASARTSAQERALDDVASAVAAFIERPRPKATRTKAKRG